MPIFDVFRVEREQIQNLNDAQARELIAQLCKAECQKFGGKGSSVTWGGDQRAADGGVDVLVNSDIAPGGMDFIPARITAFQVKAESFPASKIANEVAPKGRPRGIYEKLQESGDGSYVIVSTKDDCTGKMLNERLREINETLAKVGYKNSFKTDFYCSSRLADWVELHPAVAIWVKSSVGAPVEGWKPYGPWAYKEADSSSEYLIDDQLRILIPGEDAATDIQTAFKKIRLSLQSPCSIRIVGLSGVGKTRMVQALFDDRVFPDQFVPPKESVIYCDLGDEMHPKPKSMVELLAQKNSNNIVVIDNCSSSEHQRVTESILKSGQNIKLITIEYDIRDDSPDDTDVYTIEGASKDLIFKLLQKKFPNLSDIDAQRISEYSEGNARIALVLAGMAKEKGEFAQLRNEDLFNRLFHQKNNQNDDLLRSAEVASLLYSFNYSDSDETELRLLASLADCSISLFRRHIAELRRRGLVQARDIWRAILPQAISNRLAAKGLDNFSLSTLMDCLYKSAPERVKLSFTRRLGYLQDNHHAKAIAQTLVNTGLEDISTFSNTESKVFSNLAPLCPDYVLKSIARWQAEGKYEDAGIAQRRDHIRLARLIAYEAVNFDSAVGVLLSFCNIEYAKMQDNGAKKALLGFFQIRFSETHASLDQRLKIADELALETDSNLKMLTVEIVREGLRTSDFSSSFDYSFGSRSRDYGYNPSSPDEACTWFKRWLNFAKTSMEKDGDLAKSLRDELARRFRGLWRTALVDDFLFQYAIEINRLYGWPQCWFAAKDILRFDALTLSKESINKIRQLEELLRPTDSAEKIRALIISSNREIFELGQIDSKNLAEAHQLSAEYATKLGSEIANEPALNNIGPELLYAENPHCLAFAKGIGRAHVDPAELMQQFKLWIKKSSKNANLYILCGVVASWTLRDPEAVESFLDLALNDEVWSFYFIPLQMYGPRGEKYFERLFRSIDENKIPIHQYRLLARERATDWYPIHQIITLINKINAGATEALLVSFELIWMNAILAKDKDQAYQDELKDFITAFLKSVDWQGLEPERGNLGLHVDGLFDLIVPNADASDVGVILENFLTAERNSLHYWRYDRNSFFKPFLEHFPHLTLDLIHQPDEDGDYAVANRIARGSLVGESSSVLAMVPSSTLIEWCERSPADRYPYMAAVCQLFTFEENPSSVSKEEFSEIAIKLVELAPELEKIIAKYARRVVPINWDTSRVTLLESRLKLLSGLNPTNSPKIKAQLNILEAELNQCLLEARKETERTERKSIGRFE